MPRKKRNLVNSGVYHIMVRGVNKQLIFNDDKDRRMFIRLMYYYKTKLKCNIYAYCLMNNHVHILFEDKEFLISDFMRNITSVYAGEFNKKYKRVGHLFQDRFKSIYVYNDDYLLRLVRYIHRNPERAGICKTEEYKWSSYKEYIYDPKVIENNKVLLKLDSNKKNAIKKFKEFVRDKSEEELDKIYSLEKLKDEEAAMLIKNITKVSDISLIKSYSKSQKKEVITRILQISNLTDNQIARVLGISKNFRTKMK